MDSNVVRLPLADAQALSDSDVLTATVELLSTADTLARVTTVVTGAIRSLLHCDGATFALRDQDACICIEESAATPLWKGRRLSLADCVSGWAMVHGEVVVLHDVSTDLRISHDIYRDTAVTSLVVAPVRVAEPVAALGAYWSAEHRPTPAEVRLLEILANSASVAMENLELREAVRRRADERDHLAARADELEAAIHTIVHDLRSPLGAMLGYAELIEDSLASGSNEVTAARTQQFVRTIADSGRRMADQIDRTLALYGVTRRPLEPQRLDLTAMAQEVISSLRAAALDRTLDVTVEDGLEAEADPVLTYLMLENLLGNAVKYTAREPVAYISLSRVTSLREVGGAPVGSPGPLTTFVVRDNGAGFPSHQTDRLFRPMSRLHRDEDFPGTGLGLASVARIVERHGGQIHAEGAPLCGASFYFSLPRPAPALRCSDQS